VIIEIIHPRFPGIKGRITLGRKTFDPIHFLQGGFILIG
jgi:hypothetical protein